ncbi:hypothetical protein [Halomonas salipaludis]|uniref:Uncharacterized protein n=1 Tax=Halomonas salipaludis TaxID=2032625 RepID=A0A2A2ETY3_9GAMM|nr:hypothetical protein [Halomonas salipaludis]PAU75875.1 hypothetical protein CK498_13200 [Halomonas salipaludis]
MPESPFYAKAMRGASKLVGHWLLLGQADPDRLAMILADTARVAKLGEPEETPDGATLGAWSGDATPPLWAARAATFLLLQMPAKPLPRDEFEACAWAYCWLRLRHFESLADAQAALPAHLAEPLAEALPAAWHDHQRLRLI